MSVPRVLSCVQDLVLAARQQMSDACSEMHRLLKYLQSFVGANSTARGDSELANLLTRINFNDFYSAE